MLRAEDIIRIALLEQSLGDPLRDCRSTFDHDPLRDCRYDVPRREESSLPSESSTVYNLTPIEDPFTGEMLYYPGKVEMRYSAFRDPLTDGVTCQKSLCAHAPDFSPE